MSEIQRYQPVVLDLVDDVGLGAITVYLEPPSLGKPTELIYSDGQLGSLFSSTTTSIITGGLRLTINRSGGWQWAPTLRVSVWDISGNHSEATYSFTLATDATVSGSSSPLADRVGGRDLALENGDIAMPLRFTAGLEAVAQSVGIRLSFFKGEFFLDEDVGVPYYQSIFVKRPDIVAIRQIYREQLLATPGVLDIKTMDMRIEPRTRVLSGEATVNTDLGELTVPVTAEVING